MYGYALKDNSGLEFYSGFTLSVLEVMDFSVMDAMMLSFFVSFFFSTFLRGKKAQRRDGLNRRSLGAAT